MNWMYRIRRSAGWSWPNACRRPSFIAPYTAVDQAESEPDEAFRINADGARNVAMAAKAIGAKLCYISTDYVFDGMAAAPYEEQAQTNPQTVYGRSKLAGEREVQSASDEHFIVRTSWVFGKFGRNFVKTIRKLAGEQERLQVVNDQFGSPTYTLDLAQFLIELVQTEHYGIYHASNGGACSCTILRKRFWRKAESPKFGSSPARLLRSLALRRDRRIPFWAIRRSGCAGLKS